MVLIVLFKKYYKNIENIKNFFNKCNKKVYNCLFTLINFDHFISLFKNETILEDYYQYYKNIDFLYNQSFEIIHSENLYEYKINQNQQMMKGKEINQDFYDGYGIDI